MKETDENETLSIDGAAFIDKRINWRGFKLTPGTFRRHNHSPSCGQQTTTLSQDCQGRL